MNEADVQVPTWTKVVGIIAISCGILGLGFTEYARMMPRMMAFSIEMSKIHQPDKPGAAKPATKEPKMLKENIPGWVHSWWPVIFLLGYVVNGLYIYAGFALLQLKGFAIRLFYLSAALALAHAILRQVIIAQALVTPLAIVTLVISIPGALINLMLFIFVLCADKEAFHREIAA